VAIGLGPIKSFATGATVARCRSACEKCEREGQQPSCGFESIDLIDSDLRHVSDVEQPLLCDFAVLVLVHLPDRLAAPVRPDRDEHPPRRLELLDQL
jgi:hypothetical protein